MSSKKIASERGRKALEKKLKEKDREIGELKNSMKYLQAEFENFRKGAERAKADFEKRANRELIKELLVFIDDLERSVGKTKDKETRSGIEMVLKNVTGLLERKGLRRIEALGKKFDPYYHEAVLTGKSDMPEGTVIEEMQTGYLLNSEVIRHSKVKVAKN